jgi:choline/glycine/proline betaine transport protein
MVAKDVSVNRETFEHEARTRVLGMEIHTTVFLGAAGIIIGAVLLALINADSLQAILETIKAVLSTSIGWFYIIAVNVFLLFILFLLFSRYGTIRIGGPEARPEFGRLSWLAMLFSAGMGVGLYFNGVYEPVSIYAAPPLAAAETQSAAQEALGFVNLHWALHPWATYSVLALVIAFFVYNRGLPMAVRSAFYPLLGDRIYGWIGNVVDIIAIIATLFGVATSLGLGAEQINAGLSYLYNVPQDVVVQLFIITLITASATISVISGLNAGIRQLSRVALILGAVLLVMVFILGPTLALLDTVLQSSGYYLQQLPFLSTWSEAFQEPGSNWQSDWTISYWAWWISWAPFVGIFVARISKGRTIREFILGVLLVPAIISILWFSVFGGAAFWIELYGGGGLVQPILQDDAIAIYVLLEQFPLASITSLLALAGVTIFFITSSDSGSLVIDIISAGGHTDPPTRQRIFWAVLEGVVAGTLLLGGGLSALQTAVTMTGLPFAIVMLIAAYGLFIGLRRELRQLDADKARAEEQAASSAT